MKRIIDNWYHKPGMHCASTAIRDAMTFWGHNISEAFCFGLGRGIGAFYMSNPNFSPSKWLMTRGADLEEHYFKAIGHPFAWKQADDADTAWNETRKDIDAGLPVLIHTDLHYLDYYNTKTHFNRHAVLLWGYDEEKGIGYLSDTDREGLIEISLDSLAKARNSDFPPGPVKFDWYPIKLDGRPVDLKRAALEAIRINALELSGVPKDYPLKMGLQALQALTDDLPEWPKASDWSWSARFAYQAIERRGTGGSGFRKMYTEFLEEVEAMAPEIKPLKLAALMRAIAAKWSELAAALKAMSEKSEPNGFNQIQALSKELHAMESNYCSVVLANVEVKKSICEG